MAHIVENLVLEACTAEVASAAQLPLQGTLPGYRTFAAVCANNDTLHYLIREVDVVGRPTGKYELGRGAFIVSGGNNYLDRTTVINSSNSNAPETWAAGTIKYVSLTQLAPVTQQVREDLQSAMGLNFVGMVGMFPVNTLPTGWLKANGAAVSRTTYGRLYSYLGSTYGSGDGTTTFNLPDYRGEFPRFFDDGRGLDSGRTISTVQSATVLQHNHAITDSGHAHGVADPWHAHSGYTDTQGYHVHGIGNKGSFGGAPGYVDSSTASSSGYANTDGAGNHSHTVTINANGTGISIYGAGTGISVNNTGGAENRPRNIAVCAYIKF